MAARAPTGWPARAMTTARLPWEVDGREPCWILTEAPRSRSRTAVSALGDRAAIVESASPSMCNVRAHASAWRACRATWARAFNSSEGDKAAASEALVRSTPTPLPFFREMALPRRVPADTGERPPDGPRPRLPDLGPSVLFEPRIPGASPRGRRRFRQGGR